MQYLYQVANAYFINILVYTCYADGDFDSGIEAEEQIGLILGKEFFYCL